MDSCIEDAPKSLRSLIWRFKTESPFSLVFSKTEYGGEKISVGHDSYDINVEG